MTFCSNCRTKFSAQFFARAFIFLLFSFIAQVCEWISSLGFHSFSSQFHSLWNYVYWDKGAMNFCFHRNFSTNCSNNWNCRFYCSLFFSVISRVCVLKILNYIPKRVSQHLFSPCILGENCKVILYVYCVDVTIAFDFVKVYSCEYVYSYVHVVVYNESWKQKLHSHLMPSLVADAIASSQFSAQRLSLQMVRLETYTAKTICETLPEYQRIIDFCFFSIVPRLATENKEISFQKCNGFSGMFFSLCSAIQLCEPNALKA